MGDINLDSALQSVRERLRETKEGDVIETEYTFEKDGSKSYWLFRDTVFSRCEDKEPECILGLAQDITELKRTEKAKHRAEGANKAKDAFIATLSHELRTPLTPVLLAASSLEQDKLLHPELHPKISLIRRSAELEARLIDDLLDITKIARGKLSINPEMVNVHTLLDRAIEVVDEDLQDKRIVLEVDKAALQATAQADPTRLQQVFWNLIKNAVKFTSPGGKVRISTSNPAPSVLLVEVVDTGTGIAPEMLEKIFLPFEQGAAADSHRFGGLGLGLAISKAIVNLHGGSIFARSAGENKGATFAVELPVSLRVAKVASQMSRDLEKIAGRHLHILLVEDNEATRDILASLLSREGHEVETASNCDDARKLVLDEASTDKFEVLISDLGLPDGSGLTLVEELKAELPEMRAIALSGYGTDEDVQKSLQAGFNAHLTKPIAIEELRRVLAA
jgi:signal transduction histidine kinase